MWGIFLCWLLVSHRITPGNSFKTSHTNLWGKASLNQSFQFSRWLKQFSDFRLFSGSLHDNVCVKKHRTSEVVTSVSTRLECELNHSQYSQEVCAWISCTQIKEHAVVKSTRYRKNESSTMILVKCTLLGRTGAINYGVSRNHWPGSPEVLTLIY